MERFDGVKIFSATMARDRDELGERLTEWLRQHPEVNVVECVVTQSSDEAYHCLSLTVFFRINAAAAARVTRSTR